MIREGTEGSLCIYYKGDLISGFPLSKKRKLDHYLNQGEYLIKKSKGMNILTQIETYIHFCNVIHKRKIERRTIRRTDHQLFISCLFALIRLRVIEDDDMNGYYCFPRKKLVVN